MPPPGVELFRSSEGRKLSSADVFDRSITEVKQRFYISLSVCARARAWLVLNLRNSLWQLLALGTTDILCETAIDVQEPHIIQWYRTSRAHDHALHGERVLSNRYETAAF